MGRKNKSQQAGEALAPAPGDADDGVATEDHRLDDMLDGLTEKRAQTRLASLAALFAALATRYESDWVESHEATLHDSLLRCLRRGGAEGEQAARALCVVLLTTGADEDSSLTADLTAALTLSTTLAAVPAAWTALALLMDLLPLPAPDKAARVQALLALAAPLVPSAPALPHALRALALLLSALPAAPALADDALRLVLRVLASTADPDAMLAASALAAVVCVGADAADSASAEAADGNGHAQGDRLAVTRGAVEERLGELAGGMPSSRGAGAGKKADADTRAGMRGARDAVAGEGGGEEMAMKLKHQKIEFDGYVEVFRARFYVAALEKGTEEHFVNNPLVGAQLGFELDASRKPKRMSSLEKRLYMSQNSPAAKDRFLTRSRGRDQKRNAPTALDFDD